MSKAQPTDKMSVLWQNTAKKDVGVEVHADETKSIFTSPNECNSGTTQKVPILR